MSPEAIERLSKQLQQYVKDHKQGQQNQQDAQQLRKQAEEVLKNMTPEERQTLEKVARDWAEQNRDQGKGQEQPKDRAGDQSHDQSKQNGEPSGQYQQGAGQQGANQQDKPQTPGANGDKQDQPGASGQKGIDQGQGERDAKGVSGAGREPSGAKAQGEEQGAHGQRSGSDKQPNGAREAGDGPAGTTGDGAGAGQGRKNPARRTGAAAAPTQTEPVDARGQPRTDPSEHVIADYFNNKPGPRTGAPGPTLQQGVSDAAKGAERAIEQQAVPSQYSDLVRRVFKRYVERVQPGADRDAPAPGPAQK
jgi:hypothetical protein